MSATARSSEPLYVRVTSQIAGLVDELSPGDRLPSERELCQQLGVSRVTLRTALGRLVDQGLIVSAAARGWFVAERDAPTAPAPLGGFSAMAASRGLRVGSRVLLATTRAADLDEAESLQIAPGAPLFELRRLRLLDGLVTALDHSRVPLGIAAGIEDADYERVSLYDTLRSLPAPVIPFTAQYSVAAAAATDEQACHLELDAGAPVLVAVQLTFDHTGRRVELGETAYRGDRYRFLATITASPGEQSLRP